MESLVFFENLKFIFTAVMIYAIVFGILKKVNWINDQKINSVIALMAAIIVSLTGVVTFSLFYSVRLFSILITLIFFIIVTISFTGIEFRNIANSKIGKYTIIGLTILVFFILFLKSFSALNNSELKGSQEIDTSFNVGVNFPSISVSSTALTGFLFFVILGVFVIFIGK